MAHKDEKAIRVAIRNGDFTKVKVNFFNGSFTPEEFTAIFMALLESYTLGLKTTNTNEQIFDHFNRVFGIFLNKLVPPEEHYKLSKEHKEFKEAVDATLGRPETEEDKKETEDVRFASYLLARDILIKDAGFTEETADMLLNKRLGLLQPKLTKEVVDNANKGTK